MKIVERLVILLPEHLQLLPSFIRFGGEREGKAFYRIDTGYARMASSTVMSG
jgi:hypothetical protein